MGIQLAEQGVGVGVIAAGEIIVRVNVAPLQVLPVAEVVDAGDPVSAARRTGGCCRGQGPGRGAVAVPVALVPVFR